MHYGYKVLLYFLITSLLRVTFISVPHDALKYSRRENIKLPDKALTIKTMIYFYKVAFDEVINLIWEI